MCRAWPRCWTTVIVLASRGSALQVRHAAAPPQCCPYRPVCGLGASSAVRTETDDASVEEVDSGAALVGRRIDGRRSWSPSSPASRWNARGGDEDRTKISSLLVCGDGDLSYSAAVAPELAALGIRLTATVLEEREVHHDTYRNSRDHARTILSSSSEGLHEVAFGVDATDLTSSFPNRTFDRIQFNFPHWRGKANHRRNRALLSDFLRSAAASLTSSPRPDGGGSGGGGEIHVALCQGQGGATASTNEEWRGSWKAAEYANEHGLLLLDVFPYLPTEEYDLSSHRGVDRAFAVGKVPKMYVFAKPGGGEGKAGTRTKAPREFQMCCRHELHLNLPDEMDVVDDDSRYSLEDIVDGDAVREIIESVVPDGVRVEVPMRRCLSPEETGSSCRVGVYLVVYAGEGRPLTRPEADEYRAAVEREVANHVPLRANRAGRMVSRPLPYPLVQGLVYNFFQQGRV